MRAFVRGIETLDISLVSFLATRRRLSLTSFMKLITRLGDGPLWVVLSLAMLVSNPEGTTVVVRLAIAFAIELSFYKLSKTLLPRLRPCDFLPRVSRLVIPPDRYSFPSGHTATAFITDW